MWRYVLVVSVAFMAACPLVTSPSFGEDDAQVLSVLQRSPTARVGTLVTQTPNADQIICGNGIRQGDQDCDSNDLGGQTCQGLGYHGGQLRCSTDCTFDKSGCEAAGYCGDGVRQAQEECDGEDFGGQTCRSLGFPSHRGVLRCTPDCRFDTSGCVTNFCGDGILQTQFGEQCDFGHALPNGLGRVLQIVITNQVTCVLRQAADGGVVTCRGETKHLNPQELAAKRFTKIAVLSFGLNHALCGVESPEGKIFCQSDASWVNTGKSAGGGHVDIAAGWEHLCAVDAGNRLTCWGDQTCFMGCWSDNMGDLTTLRVKQVEVAGAATCYLKTDGTVGCFGSDWKKIVSAAPAGRYRRLAVGGVSACGVLQEAWTPPQGQPLRAGDLVCWGESSGQVNDPTKPLLNVGGLSGGPYADVVVADNYACARKENAGQSQWECWGSPSDLANHLLLPHGADVTHVAPIVFFGGGGGCITRVNGTVLCTSGGHSASLPRGFVLGGAMSVKRVVMAWGVTFLLGRNGGVTVIGAAMPPSSNAMPAQGVLDVAGDVWGIVGNNTLSDGGFCAVTSQSPNGNTGQPMCWGSSNYAAILGNNVPIHSDFVRVVVGADYFRRPLPFACGLRDGNEQSGYRVRCWGENIAPVTGAPSSEERGYTQLAVSKRKGVCARKVDGTAVCWGENANNHLAVPSLSNGHKFTNQLVGSAGSSSSFFCFIANDTGELSNTKGGYIVCSGAQAPTPPVGSDFIQLAADERTLCALRLSGEVECVTQSQASPEFATHPLGSVRVDQFAIARKSLCGLQRGTGLVVCAGENDYGQAPPWPLSNLGTYSCTDPAKCQFCHTSCKLLQGTLVQ